MGFVTSFQLASFAIEMLSKIVALSLAAAASAFAPAALPGRVTSRGEQRHILTQQLRRGALCVRERATARRGI
jgi:hypothetical protein